MNKIYFQNNYLKIYCILLWTKINETVILKNKRVIIIDVYTDLVGVVLTADRINICLVCLEIIAHFGN